MRLKRLGVIATAAAVGALVATIGVDAASKSEQRNLFSVMLGKNEVAETTERGTKGKKRRKGAGDRDGRGSFTALVDGSQLCYGIVVKDIGDPVAAHIHRGRPSVNGPVVFTLKHPTAGNPGASSDCGEIDTRLARSILKNPGKFYVNVHNSKFPDGAVRGQVRSKRSW